MLLLEQEKWHEASEFKLRSISKSGRNLAYDEADCI
jgi:hypothetical protein